MLYPAGMHIDHDGALLTTEADVEMKIIVPLLRGAAYLDIPEDSVKAKKYLAPTPFNRKAGQTSGSYPDFTVWFRSFPCLIVEAKAPDVAVEVGYHEAQLYAAYLNQNYPTGINPARSILATNGKQFMFGYWDSKPVLQGDVSDLRPQTSSITPVERPMRSSRSRRSGVAMSERFHCEAVRSSGQSRWGASPTQGDH